jgi:hypothetical protein
MEVAKTLAYYNTATLTAIISFIEQVRDSKTRTKKNFGQSRHKNE